MAVAALVVSVVSAAVAAISALAAIIGLLYVRRSTKAAEVSAVASQRAADTAERSADDAKRSADAAVDTARLDGQRRTAELTPRFWLTCTPTETGSGKLRLFLRLLGPLELERLDWVTVNIRDKERKIGSGSRVELLAAQVWGRWQFTTFPELENILPTGVTQRAAMARNLRVAEQTWWQLESTQPPSWLEWSLAEWKELMGDILLLELICRRGELTWTVPCEVTVGEDRAGSAEAGGPV